MKDLEQTKFLGKDLPLVMKNGMAGPSLEESASSNEACSGSLGSLSQLPGPISEEFLTFGLQNRQGLKTR